MGYRTHNIHDTRHFLRRHHMYIKSDFNKFALYSLFTPMEPFPILFLLYVEHLLGSFAIAGILLSLKMILSLILQVLFSGIKDRTELKYSLAAAEFLIVFGYLFLILASVFNQYTVALLCIGVFFVSMAGSLWKGTYNSFIYEDFEKDHPDIGSKPYSRLQTIFHIGLALNAIICTTLAGVYSYEVGLLFGVFSNVIAGFLALSLKGPANCKDPIDCQVKPEISIVHFTKSIKKMFGNKKLKYISLAEIIRLSLVETFNTYSIPFYKTFIPISIIGYIQAIKEIGAAVSFSLADMFIRKLKFFKAVKLFYVIRWGLMALAVIVNGLMSPVFLSIRSLFFGPMVTSTEYMMQKNYSEEERVTMSSSLSILSSLLSAILVFILGYISEIYSIQCALGVIVPFYVIPYLLYKKQFRILGKE